MALLWEIPSDVSIIPLEDIKQATNNFAQQNIIQNIIEKKYYKWIVYKGELSGKKLAFISIRGLSYIGSLDLRVLNELTEHPNIVSLIGICVEDGERILVLEHPIRGGLDKHVSSTAHLTWLMRLRICLDIASALHFLQNHPQRSHMYIADLNSASIHLDENWQAKIQLIKPKLVYDIPISLMPDHLAYADPSCRHTGKQSEIYSFGVILFELLCARPAVTYDEEGGEQFLSKLACSHYEKGTLTEIIDPLLRVQMNRDSFTVFSELAYRCLSEDESIRSTISAVIEQLQKVLKLQQVCQNSLSRPTSVGIRELVSNQMVDGLDVIKTHNVSGVWSGEYMDCGLTQSTKELDRIFTMLEEQRFVIIGEASIHKNHEGRNYEGSRIRPTIGRSFDNRRRNHSPFGNMRVEE